MATANRTALVKRVQETKVLPGEWNNDAWISALANVCWPKASDQEIMIGAAFAGTYKLNPFVGEFHMIQGRPFVGRDGFLRVATRDKRYVDHSFGKVYEKDSYHEEKGVAHHDVGGFGKGQRGKFLGAFCTIYTQGPEGDVLARTYTAEVADFAAYIRDPKKQNWQRDPEGMTVVRCLTTAFRATFSLGALYTVEEAPDVLDGEVVDLGPAIEQATEDKKSEIKRRLAEMEGAVEMPGPVEGEVVNTESDLKERMNLSNAIIDLAEADEMSMAFLYEVLGKRFNVAASSDMTNDQLKEVVLSWEEIKEDVAEYVKGFDRTPRESDNS